MHCCSIRAQKSPSMFTFSITRSPTLVLTSRALRRNVRHALKLANIVADSRYRLYEDFVDDGSGRGLGEYLAALRLAVLAGIEGGGADPFRAVSA